MTARMREARAGRADVFNEALRTWFKALVRAEGAWREVKERGIVRAALVRNIVADMLAMAGL